MVAITHNHDLKSLRNVAAAAAGLLVALAVSPAQAGPYLLFNDNTGEVLAQENAFQRWHPASLTKLMTAYVAFDMVRAGEISLNTMIRITANAAKDPPSRTNYPVGTQLTLDDAIKILMVVSANDIATSIAENTSGSVQAFTERMNATAVRLGMYDSHFVNAHGLHAAEQYMTARDLAVLVQAIRTEFPSYNGYFDIEGVQIGERKAPNSNPLIGRFTGANGMKTGYICASGYNLVASASRGGTTVTAVVLGSVTQTERANLAATLLETGLRGEVHGTSLANFRPSAAVAAGPVNIREAVCPKDPKDRAVEPRDAKGQLVFNSPLIRDATHEPQMVQINAILPPPPVAQSNTKGSKKTTVMPRYVPLPTPRPNYQPQRASTGQ